MAISTIEYVYRTFTAGEAEQITGTSGALQRDWRRRGLLAKDDADAGKWTRFSLDEVVKMLLMKQLSDLGFSVKSVLRVAAMAAFPLHKIIHSLPGAIEHRGISADVYAAGDGAAARQVSSEGERGIGPAESLYLVVTRKDRRGEPAVARCDALDGLSGYLAEKGVAHCVVIDLFEIARTIRRRVTGPFLTIVETAKAEGSPV